MTRRGELGEMLPPLLVAALCWPLSEGAGGLLLRHHGIFQMLFLRYASHLFVLLPIALVSGGRRTLRTSHLVLQLLRGFCMFLMPAFFLASMRFAGPHSFWFVFSSVPVLALGAAVLLGERPGAGVWLAAFAGWLGAWLIRGGAPESLLATIMALGATACFACYLALSRLLREERLVASLFYTAIGAIAPAAIIAAVSWTPVVASDVVPALSAGALSVILLGGLDLSLEIAGLSLVAPGLALVPLFEVGLIAAFTARPPAIPALLGAALILAGLALLAASERNAKTRRQAPVRAQTFGTEAVSTRGELR